MESRDQPSRAEAAPGTKPAADWKRAGLLIPLAAALALVLAVASEWTVPGWRGRIERQDAFVAVINTGVLPWVLFRGGARKKER